MGKPLTKRIQRRYPEALDITEVHPDRLDAEDYALINPTSYTGQILSFTENGVTRAGIIQPDKRIFDITPVTYIWNATFNNQNPATRDGTVTVHTVYNTNPIRRVADVHLRVNITSGTTTIYLPFPADNSRTTQILSVITAEQGNNRFQYFQLTQTGLPISGLSAGYITVFGRYSILNY